MALGIHQINLDDQDHTFSEQEVWTAIKEMPSEKAPGPDGFTGAFYKSGWPIVKDEVMATIHSFAHADNRAFSKLNNALIVLVPKKMGARCPTDFRPKTMIHSIAKIISKVLTLRLAPRLNEIMARNQNAFIRERTIHDNYKYIQMGSGTDPEEKDIDAATQVGHLQSIRYTVMAVPPGRAQGARFQWYLETLDSHIAQHSILSDPPQRAPR